MPQGQPRAEGDPRIDWTAATVKRLGPLSTPPRLPDIPEPRADNLKPFLGRSSPCDP